MKKINAYWFVSRMYGLNFGDMLTPELISAYGGEAEYNKDPVSSSLISVGSILDLVPEAYQGTILGSGFILPNNKRGYQRANIVGVRGKLTQQRIQGAEQAVLGDPGLLSADLLPVRSSKQHTVGIIPHFQDKDNPQVRSLIKQEGVYLIDVQRPPAQVLADIDACEYILSSSLHGLVCADALGVPSGWVVLSNLLKGGPFKFQDYYSALGTEAKPQQVNGRETINDLVGKTRQPASSLEDVISVLRETYINTIRQLGEGK